MKRPVAGVRSRATLELSGRFLLAGIALVLSLSLMQTGCAEGMCLADGQNCSQTFLQNNGLEGYTCCNGQTCREGPTSGVLICRF